MAELEALWVDAMTVLAWLASLLLLVLLVIAELWVARNMVRGWRDPSGWRGMVAVAADMDHREGRGHEHPGRAVDARR
jgi:hypothetical protein